MDDILLHSDDFILKARDHMDCWDFIPAKRVLEQLLEEYPEHSEGHHLLGKIYAEQLKRYDQAAEHYTIAINYAPTYHEPYISYLTLLKLLGRGKEMLKMADKAEKIQNMDKGIMAKFRGEAYEIMLELDIACRHYEEAILHSRNNDDIESLEESIDRLRKKNDLLIVKGYFKDVVVV